MIVHDFEAEETVQFFMMTTKSRLKQLILLLRCLYPPTAISLSCSLFQ